MTDRRPPLAFLLVLAVVAGVVVLLGALAFQAFTGTEREAPPTFVQQLEGLSFVEEVETDSERIVGAGQARRLESWVTLSPEVTADPDAAAAQLAGVTWGYDRSHWTVRDLGSTADVSYRAPVDDAPVRWWMRSVAALEDAAPGAELHCRITDAALRCEVESDDPGAARQALAAVDASALQPWLDAASPDEGEESGFWLQVGGETLTDPASVR